MAVRQYIGARYVPRFSDVNNGIWSNVYSYEPLTIVKNGNDYYTSKQSVPVGIAITNTDYWVKTGDYNGAINSLQEQIDDMKDGDVSGSLQNQIDDMKDGDVSGSLQNQISGLDAIVTADKDHIIAFGDSWTDEDVDVNIRLTRVLSRRFNATVKTYGKSGTGFDVPNGYDAQLGWFATDIQNGVYDLNRIKCLVLVCGLNDYQRETPSISADTFTSMLNDWVNKARAIVGNNMPIYWFHNYSVANDLTLTHTTTFYNQWSYYNYVKENCTKNVYAADTFGFCNSWRNDTHPDGNGSMQFYENVANVIQGLPVNIYKYQTITATWDTNRQFIFDYWYRGGPILDVDVHGSINDLKAIAAEITLTYDHTPPARFENYISFNGVRLYDSSYNGFKANANNADLLSGYTASGYYNHRFTIS